MAVSCQQSAKAWLDWGQGRVGEDLETGSGDNWETFFKKQLYFYIYLSIYIYLNHYIPEIYTSAIYLKTITTLYSNYTSIKKCLFIAIWGFPGGTSGKEPAAKAGDVRETGFIPGQEDPLEEGRATQSSILAWRIPWTEEPAGLQSIGLQSDTTEATWHTSACTHTHTHVYIFRFFPITGYCKILNTVPCAIQ